MKEKKKNNKAREEQQRKGMNREAEDELLTTGGPVDRSAIEDEGDRGSVDAHTGGMTMKDEEANPNNDAFVQGKARGKKSGRSARYGKPEEGIQGKSHPGEDLDTSQDKTEGITRPRTTMDDWKKFKNYRSSPGEDKKDKKDKEDKEDIKARGKNKNEDTGSEFNDIAPV